MDRYVFDPAEDAWVAYLKLVQSERVGTNLPKGKDRPPFFIEVERIGGASGLALDEAIMLFRCWGPSRAKAAKFATDLVRLVMSVQTLAGRSVTRKQVVGDPVYVPDPVSGTDRYQFTIRAAIRGQFPTP